MTNSLNIKGNLVDIRNKKIYPAKITVANGKISAIEEISEECSMYIMPGFVDAHVHVESSMLIPSEFARLSVVHGTVATISDPHEIGNVNGTEGVRYMIENGKKTPFKFYFGAPSCVPATAFETAGAEITASDIRELFEKDGLVYLSEMMNFPGVLYNDPVVMEKIKIAKELGRPVDGHSPGLRGDDAKKYIDAGISTDHECFTLEEAQDKLKYGMKILIREGSAAKNYEALHTLISSHPDKVMFCSDDKHPNDLVEGHINQVVKRSIEKGYDLFDILRCACINPVEHYGMDVGTLRVGDPADFIVMNDLTNFRPYQTYIDGSLVAENGITLLESVSSEIINNFNATKIKPADIEIKATGKNIKVIEAIEGQLITKELHYTSKIENDLVVSDISRDILKLIVVERYKKGNPALAFIQNFGLKKGAIASSVGHDSHNIIAVGVDDKSICDAVNIIIENKGGVSVSIDGRTEILPLPVSGIMSNIDGYKVADGYSEIDKLAKECGTGMYAPYMTLSFMALLVIPFLKLSDKGLFDGGKFEFTDLQF
ncbi:adenine deaminase [soil metagenome]